MPAQLRCQSTDKVCASFSEDDLTMATVSYTGLRPWMMRTSTAMTASTRRMCIKPPRVYELTIPSNHNTNRMTAIVQSICVDPFLLRQAFDTKIFRVEKSYYPAKY